MDVNGDGIIDIAGTAPAAARLALDDQLAVSATFTQDMGVGQVSINVGYETGRMNNGASPSILNAGASVAVGDITVSGGMSETDGGAMNTDVGAVMSMGALSLSAAWGGTNSSDMYALGAGYPLGPGVALDVQLDFGSRAVSAADPDGAWVQFMIGTSIAF